VSYEQNILRDVRSVNKHWRLLTQDRGLWMALCLITEKNHHSENSLLGVADWEHFYVSNPHVPLDFSNITCAIHHASACKSKTRVHQIRIFCDCVLSDQDYGSRVIVGPGDYHENLCLEYNSHIQASSKGMVSLTFDTARADTPTIDIKVRMSLPNKFAFM
jgi:hypothetical protein